MTFDGFFLHHMTQELRETVLGGRIQKVNLPFEKELVLQVRNQGKNHKLLLSAHPVFARIQLTETKFENPAFPNTLTMIFRKYLQGAVIENLEQDGNDRLLEMTISNKNEIGDAIQVRLIIEIMGKHSNIILMDKATGKIIEAIKHVGFSQNSYRTILPGSTYLYPPKAKGANPFDISEEELFETLQTQDLTPKNLQSLFQGLGRQTAQALSHRLDKNKLTRFRDFFQKEASPSLYQKQFAAFRLDESAHLYPSLSQLLDAFYEDKAERDRVQQQASQIIKKVENELDKNRKKLIKQEEELAATDHAEEFRQKGELLTTFLHQVPNDQDQVQLDNYYTNEQVTISLNKALTPSQNAQRYFKRYQKLKEAVKHLNGLIQETREAINYLESVQIALEQASLSEIAEIREELIQTGYIRRRNKEKIQKRKKPERYLASDGKTIILVGRNNLQNDELSFKLSKKGELWFHAKDLPGSHVLIKDNLDPSDEVKTDAAELAAYYSKARLSNLVQVDMLEVQKLHKPSAGKPGFVTYRGQKTLRVTPNQEKIQAMKID